jgi:DNA-binding CsgD family transcriptional regulator
VPGFSARQLRGRGEQLRTLGSLCERVNAGQSAALVIRGEPGVGKSALLRSVAERVAGTFRIAEVAGVESEMELAYAGLHQLCLPLLNWLDAVPKPQQLALRIAFGLAEGNAPDRFLVGLATLSLLAEVAEERPLMCLVDDAQWLDDASAEVLGFAARRLSAESVALLFVIRERHDQTDRGRFAGVPVMPVGGVSGEDARALLATVVPGILDQRVCDRLVAETGGNPLALLELPRGMSSAELAAGLGLPSVGGVTARLHSHYLRRIRRLPESTQRLMLLAASDAIGDATTLWRAAATLGIGPDALAPAAGDDLFEVGAQVRFHHPLVRSALYYSASEEERRVAHGALAKATDPVTDPDRRAWHLAHATPGPNDDVAEELELSAGRAQSRGGFAAAAALMERSANLTRQSTKRVERRLSAVQFQLRAGAFDAAMGLLAVVESEGSDEHTRARVELLRAEVASASNTGGNAPLLLLRAAQRMEPQDAFLARRTYLDAWGAAMFAGHLAKPGGDLLEVSRVARAAPRPNVPMRPFGQILEGLLVLVTESPVEAEPMLRGALRALLASDLPDENWLHQGALGATAAAAMWDVESWSAVSGRQAELARNLGALAVLPTPLSGLALIATWRGDLQAAAALAAEHDAVTEAIGTRIVRYGAMLLSAYQGRAAETSTLVAATIEDSVGRGEGLGVDMARWTSAIMHNSVGQYSAAMAEASPASKDVPGLLISTWMLPERIEAAVRCGEPDTAAAAMEELDSAAITDASGWGSGLAARSRALLSDGQVAEGWYREAIAQLSRTQVRVELARAHLVFGEWLRRDSRRRDARAHLRIAHDMFDSMSADGFAERARRELLATGEHVRARGVDTPLELTPQEEQIARLARDGRSNAEVAAELYISARTVEWHLRKVFTKLGISSRHELKDAMPSRGRGTPGE